VLFNSFQFPIFLAAILALYWGAPRNARGAVLLSASLLFYFLWIPSYLLLLLGDIGINYWFYRRILEGKRPRLHLTLSIGFSLGLLAYFKYSAMFVESLLPFLRAGFGWSPDVPELFLPLGISFYSFQIIALNVDAYRQREGAPESLARYALFISFFPQLIAGPILRGSQFFPQLDTGGQATLERTRRGLYLLASGIAKKVLLADFLLAPYVNEIFAVPEVATSPLLVIAIYSFAFQVYFDFSGYSDMARGIACLFGFELPLNFSEPYLSRNPAEFWQRWHITLSTWLRDYLFFGLGGGRRGPAWAAFSLFITMLFGGLWHGAAWTFVLWGAYAGALLAGHRALLPILRKMAPKGAVASRLWTVLSIAIFLQLHCFGLILFRAESVSDAWTIIVRLVSMGGRSGWPVFQSVIVAGCMALHVGERFLRLRLPTIQGFAGRVWWGPLIEGLGFGALFVLAVAASGSGGEFIYFQF
jgi:alginate O-acetyltransferase complex protein AlgI